MQVYENGFEFTVTSGQDVCVELPAPPRGALLKLVIKQISGALDGFTANMYNRQDACAAVAEISSSFEPTPGVPDFGANKLLDPELHRIIPEVSVAASSDISAQYQLTAGYENRDEQDIRRTATSRLYLDINAGGSGDKQFQVAYAIEPITTV